MCSLRALRLLFAFLSLIAIFTSTSNAQTFSQQTYPAATPAAGSVARADLNPALKEVRSGRISPLGRALVVAQLALSVVLLVGANLFIGTLVQLYSLDSGFRREGLLTFP